MCTGYAGSKASIKDNLLAWVSSWSSDREALADPLDPYLWQFNNPTSKFDCSDAFPESPTI